MTGTGSAASMLYVTCGSLDEARAIASALVAERLAACANILSGMRSLFRWEGAVQEEEEVVLILKTAAARVPAATARVRALHSYDVPCVVEIALGRGNANFLDWIAAETAAGSTAGNPAEDDRL